MTCGIYKIENLVNHKIYIGQSKHIEKRFQQHCRDSTITQLSNDIRELGKQCFSFEIVEVCDEPDLLEKESFYIKKFNSLEPNGYNKSVFFDKSLNIFICYDLDTLVKIIDDLKSTNLSFEDISVKYNVNKRTIYYINSGEIHNFPDETYPIRDTKTYHREKQVCSVCGKIISFGATMCHRCRGLSYRKVERPDKETLDYLIHTYPFTKLAEMYGVSDNAIRKWCKSYGLEYKKLSNK